MLSDLDLILQARDSLRELLSRGISVVAIRKRRRGRRWKSGNLGDHFTFPEEGK
jgi:hypothetical protein